MHFAGNRRPHQTINRRSGTFHPFDRKSLPAAPYYAVVFLWEDRPLTPEVLISWVERLAPALLGKTLSCRLGWSPSRETALKSYQEEGSPWST